MRLRRCFASPSTLLQCSRSFFSAVLRFGGTVASRAFLAAFATTTHEVGSEARSRSDEQGRRTCESEGLAIATSARPAPGGSESGVKKCDERRRPRKGERSKTFGLANPAPKAPSAKSRVLFSSSCPCRRHTAFLSVIPDAAAADVFRQMLSKIFLILPVPENPAFLSLTPDAAAAGAFAWIYYSVVLLS